MFRKNTHLIILIISLTIIGTSIFLYRWHYLKIPLTPATTQDSWTVEANLRFRAGSGPIKVQFYIPNNPPNYAIMDESFISRNYGVTAQQEGPNRLASWSIRRASGLQSLYYRAVFYRSDPNAPPLTVPSTLPQPELSETEQFAVDLILEQVRGRSADIRTFAIETVRILNDRNDGNAEILLNRDYSVSNIVRQAIAILSFANIYAEQVNGLELRAQLAAQMQQMLAVYNGQEWVYINPTTALVGLPDNFLIWQYSDTPLSQIEGGFQAQFTISVSQNPVSALQMAQIRSDVLQSMLIKFSPFELPLRAQYIYQILLTVPIGAFILLLLRNFVGIATFGTFMPVLIALAFRETQLFAGIILFTFVVSAGLLVRFYLEQVRLLLVPRLTAILIVVVMLMLAISIFSQQLGIEQGLSIALFPMVILTMTIERMCIVWDERGAFEAIKLGTGSLFGASLAYLVMRNDEIGYLFFAFPELLLPLLSLTLWLGQYQGYRLTELYRFKSLVKK